MSGAQTIQKSILFMACLHRQKSGLEGKLDFDGGVGKLFRNTGFPSRLKKKKKKALVGFRLSLSILSSEGLCPKLCEPGAPPCDEERYFSRMNLGKSYRHRPTSQ